MYKFTIFFITCLMMCSHLGYGNEVIKKLDERMKHNNSLVCVGLDPDLKKMPLAITQNKMKPEAQIYSFLTQVIDITAPHVCSYKIQKAFFDQFDEGHELLKNVVAYIHQNHPLIPAFVDCKIGDIDNTMQAYMENLFDIISADGVVVNPYMGDDVLEPFLLDKSKVGIILIQTSNPNAKVVQELQLANGKKLWEEMLQIMLTKWNKNQNLIPVLSSNTSGDYIAIRQSIPQETPILLAGIGLQGGNPKVLRQLLNQDKRGVFVNSSRGILYPYNPQDHNWKNEVLKAVIELKNCLNDIRYGE